MTIPVAHDFICPWCWIGFLQAQQLHHEFGVDIDWLGYELFPDELEWPDPVPAPSTNPLKPKTPTRLDLAYAAQQMSPPTVERPKKMRTHNAHEALEYAKSEGVGDAFAESLYRSYWEKGLYINDPSVLATLAEGIIKDIPDMMRAIEERRFKSAIIGFDDPAYESGIFNVPTFVIGGTKYAEEPYSTLKKAVEQSKVAV